MTATAPGYSREDPKQSDVRFASECDALTLEACEEEHERSCAPQTSVEVCDDART